MATLTLYSTSGCHLCERALELLRSMPELARHTVIEVDVALDRDVLARYGARIPVLAIDDSGVEVDWPFNADDVTAALSDAR
jgi:glutaredoxin